MSSEEEWGMIVVHADVPLSEMFGYATELRSSTQGRGVYVMEPSHYAEVPKSVQEQIMIGRIDQQIRVNKILIDDCDVWKIKNKKLRNYMLSYLEIMMAVSSILAIKSKQPENLAKKKELWQYLKAKDVRAYKRIRRSIMGNTMNLPGEGGRKISVTAYKIAQMVVGFN
jgi:hypothetical protein